MADTYQDRFLLFTSAYNDIKALTTSDWHAICAFYLHDNSSPSDGKRPLDRTGKSCPLQLPSFLQVVCHRSSDEEPSFFCIKHLTAISTLNLLGSIMDFGMLCQPRLRWVHPLTHLTNHFGTLSMNFLMGLVGGIISKILLTLLAVVRCGIHMFGPLCDLSELGLMTSPPHTPCI